MSRLPRVPEAFDQLNIEGDLAYAIRWPWRDGPLDPGTTAVLRVRDEARSLPWALPGLFAVCQQVVLVDNGSTDGTADVARAVAADLGAEDKLVVTDYPFRVAPCGSEHLRTPARSMHSLAYFYEWSFSQVRTSYSLKWDGDMVLTDEGVALLGDLAWQLPGRDALLRIPRHSLYVASDAVAYLDLGLRNEEPFGSPMGPEYRHVKAFEWELRMFPDNVQKFRLPEGTCVELKWLDADEFSHWTDVGEFGRSFRTARKLREHQLFRDLVEDSWEQHGGVHRIEAPPGRHVVEYVTREWLPRAPRPLTDSLPV